MPTGHYRFRRSLGNVGSNFRGARPDTYPLLSLYLLPDGVSLYKQPDGQSLYLQPKTIVFARPDGTSRYLRPNGVSRYLSQ